MMEAKRTFSPSNLDMQPVEVYKSTERLCVQGRVKEDTTDSSPSLTTLGKQAEEHLDEVSMTTPPLQFTTTNQ